MEMPLIFSCFIAHATESMVRGFYLKTSFSHLLLHSSSFLLVAPLQVTADVLHVRTEAVHGLLFVLVRLLSFFLPLKCHLCQLTFMLRADALELVPYGGQLSLQRRNPLDREG